MKKLLAVTICAGMTLAMAACGNPATLGSVEDTQTAEGENTQIPNPFITCDTLAQAAELAGFVFSARIP